MSVETRLMLFFVISLIAVIPSMVAFFEMKKKEQLQKRIYAICGAVFIPMHIMFSTLSILAKTNDGFTIMSLTWFSIILFVLCELVLYISTVFYFLKDHVKVNAKRMYILFAVLTAVFGTFYTLYHYIICYSIDFFTLIVFLLPYISHTVVFSMLAKDVKTENNLKKLIKK